MSGSNENGSGWAQACGERFRSYLVRIRNINYRECFICFLSTLNHIFASIILFVCLVLTMMSWFIFRFLIALSGSVYCIVLIVCAALSRICPRGRNCIRKILRKRNERRRREEVHQPPREQDEGPDQLYLDDLNEVDQGPDAGPSPDGRHRAEVYYADQPSESSNLGEPVSMSSDEPLQQAASTDSGNNLPRSSTYPSTQSTSTTPLE